VSRPSHIPVCRLHNGLVAADAATCWRRAQHGAYGKVTSDAKGRQQVELAAVEAAEGRVFTDAEIAHALRTPKRDLGWRRKHMTRLEPLMPGPVTINLPKRFSFSLDEVVSLIDSYCRQRDNAWRIVLENYIKPRS
jgi:hypothetical protein